MEASRRVNGHTPHPRYVALRMVPLERDPSTGPSHQESQPPTNNLHWHHLQIVRQQGKDWASKLSKTDPTWMSSSQLLDMQRPQGDIRVTCLQRQVLARWCHLEIRFAPYTKHAVEATTIIVTKILSTIAVAKLSQPSFESCVTTSWLSEQAITHIW
jgi:hypothetical protein